MMQIFKVYNYIQDCLWSQQTPRISTIYMTFTSIAFTWSLIFFSFSFRGFSLRLRLLNSVFQLIIIADKTRMCSLTCIKCKIDMWLFATLTRDVWVSLEVMNEVGNNKLSRVGDLIRPPLPRPFTQFRCKKTWE